jgi:hypothetical protein
MPDPPYDSPMLTVGFPFGFLLGLPLGVALWFPETMFVADVLTNLLKVGKDAPNSIFYLYTIALYIVWILLVMAPLPVLLVKKLRGTITPEEKLERFGFFRGLFCSLPLATLFIDYTWVTTH